MLLEPMTNFFTPVSARIGFKSKQCDNLLSINGTFGRCANKDPYILRVLGGPVIQDTSLQMTAASNNLGQFSQILQFVY